MDEARKGEIAVLLIKDQIRRKGLFRHGTILSEIDDDIIARLKVSKREAVQFMQEVLQDAGEGANTT